MNYTLDDSCLQSILDVSQDAYIIVELKTLKLLGFNPAFEKLGLFDMHKDSNFLCSTKYLEKLASLKDVINIQLALIKNGEKPCDLKYLPIEISSSYKYNLSAKLVSLLEKNEVCLIQIRSKNKFELSDEQILTLEKRDILLRATSEVAQKLLDGSENFELTINSVLGILGVATNVDRVYVWRIHGAPDPKIDDRLYTSQLYEWSEGAEPQQGNELVTNLLVEEGIPTWIDTFLSGKCVNSLVKNMHESEREVLEAQSIISILTAPIMFHGHLWGFVGFDNCHCEYTWSTEEEDILRTAGTLISTAIYARHTNEALYEAQERFKGVEEATGDIIWSVNEQHEISYISQRIEDVLQYSPSEVIGKELTALLVCPTSFEFTATPQNPIMRDFELQVKCKDGSIKWCQSSCKYVFDENGKMTHGFGSSADVTEVHDARYALQIANKELEESINIADDLVDAANKASEAKASFLANMSHEIRTPLNAIVGITHLLKHTSLSQKQLEYITKINESSASLLNIVNDVLDFSKTQEGQMTIENKSFSIKSVFEELEITISKWLEEKELEFDISISNELEEIYLGDFVRLNQILTSLTTNAIKFTNSGKISIHVGIESENNESTLLHFSVKDTGIGISEEKMSTLFQDFTQADISSTRRYGGLGLGLALCRNLTVLMGGDIWCESQLGIGSTFHFTCRLEKNIVKEKIEKRKLKEIVIIAALEDEHTFDNLKLMLNKFGYTNISFAHDIMTINEKLFLNNTDIIILHHKFGEIEIIEKIFMSDNSYFNNIPIIYYEPEANIDDTSNSLPNSFIAINSLNASILHDTFVNVLGDGFEFDSDAYIQAAEDILKSEHKDKKILLVEDNEINQMIAQSILEEAGLSVTVANDGIEACDLIYNDSYDLVLMDIQMPKMDGLSAAQKIRQEEKFKNIPIIALTAHATEQDREKSLNAGMNDHTTKPINAQELFKMLLYWLSKNGG